MSRAMTYWTDPNNFPLYRRADMKIKRKSKWRKLVEAYIAIAKGMWH